LQSSNQTDKFHTVLVPKSNFILLLLPTWRR